MNQTKLPEAKSPEPWLRGTLADVPSVQRAVIHALELAKEDLERWCSGLTEAQLNARPAGIPPVAFHIRHIGRTADRLLTYAEGHQLSEAQIALLKSEINSDATAKVLFDELNAMLSAAEQRIRAFRPEHLDEPRAVGKKQLPTTVAGLLVHVADHTQRHVGQAITTTKIVAAPEI